MKKRSFLMLVVLVVMLFVSTACSLNKESIDYQEFNNIMTNNGFNVVNVEEQFQEYEYFEESYVALDANGNYQIEFYELEDESYAISFYNNNKSIFEEESSIVTFQSNTNLTNSNKFVLVTDTEYKVISRIDDTVIYLNVDKKYKEEVTNILKKLGY